MRQYIKPYVRSKTIKTPKQIDEQIQAFIDVTIEGYLMQGDELTSDCRAKIENDISRLLTSIGYYSNRENLARRLEHQRMQQVKFRERTTGTSRDL